MKCNRYSRDKINRTVFTDLALTSVIENKTINKYTCRYFKTIILNYNTAISFRNGFCANENYNLNFHFNANFGTLTQLLFNKIF